MFGHNNCMGYPWEGHSTAMELTVTGRFNGNAMKAFKALPWQSVSLNIPWQCQLVLRLRASP